MARTFEKVLFLVWPVLFHVSFGFVGELWAIGFSLLGVIALRKCDFSAPFRTLLASRQMIYAALCFGLAMESKLVAALAILPIGWAVAYQSYHRESTKARAQRATSITAALAIDSLLALLLLVAFSVIHSMRSINAVVIWQSFTGYISNMIGQGQGQAQALDGSHVAGVLSNFGSPIVLALFILSAAVLLYVNWAYALFLIVTLIWWLHYGRDERHLVISLFLAIILAGLEAHALIKRISATQKISNTKLSLGASAALGAVVLLVGLAFHNGFAPAKFKSYPEGAHIVQTSQGHYYYSAKLVDALRQQRYIVTSGWWQFPELTIREGLEFYDRTSPANADLPRDRVALLFDKGNAYFPLTSIQGNCERIIYTEGPLVLCKVKPSVPLNYQPPS